MRNAVLVDHSNVDARVGRPVAGDGGAVQYRAVIVLHEHHAGLQHRSALVHGTVDGPSVYLGLQVLGLLVGDRLPGGGVVRQVVRRAVDLLEVCQVVGRHGVVAAERTRVSRYSLAGLAYVRGAQAHERPVDHCLVEQVRIVDLVAQDGIAGGHVL